MAGLLDGQSAGLLGMAGPGSTLGNFMQRYGDALNPRLAHEREQENRVRMERQKILQGLGQGASLGDVATKLFQIGDIEGGLGLTRLADTQSQRDYNRKIDERNHALEVEKFNWAKSKQDVPSGFRQSTSGLEPVPGGPADPAYKRSVADRQNAPPGYLWNDPTDPGKGMKAIPGGPGEKVDAEVAGRLGLAKSFLGQLEDYTDQFGKPQKGIRARLKAGELTGPLDAAQAWMGMGGPGELRRQMDSGAEALLRMLTGAGMNNTEAKNYVRRYQFHPTDTADTALSKMNQLERELLSVGETVGKGRGGFTPPTRSAPSDRPPVPGAKKGKKPDGSDGWFVTAPNGKHYLVGE